MLHIAILSLLCIFNSVSASYQDYVNRVVADALKTSQQNLANKHKNNAYTLSGEYQMCQEGQDAALTPANKRKATLKCLEKLEQKTTKLIQDDAITVLTAIGIKASAALVSGALKDLHAPNTAAAITKGADIVDFTAALICVPDLFYSLLISAHTRSEIEKLKAATK